MQKNDTNRTDEQAPPRDVAPTEADRGVEDEVSIAPTFVTPGETSENSDRPVVNPVTGGAF
jgi:hypothetical protein